MHGLFDDLNSNIIMQELLKWEICDENTITKRTAQMRELILCLWFDVFKESLQKVM